MTCGPHIARARAKMEEALGGAADADALRVAMERGITDLDNITRVFEALLRIAEAEPAPAAPPSHRSTWCRCWPDVAEFYDVVAETRGQAIETDLPDHLERWATRTCWLKRRATCWIMR